MYASCPSGGSAGVESFTAKASVSLAKRALRSTLTAAMAMVAAGNCAIRSPLALAGFPLVTAVLMPAMSASHQPITSESSASCTATDHAGSMCVPFRRLSGTTLRVLSHCSV